MTKREIKNLPRSVHDRLRHEARKTGRLLNELRQYFAIERFLYRLSKSPHTEKFTLKGALMLTAWRAPLSRPTKDIDLLGKTDNSIATIVSVVRDICNQQVEPDGLAFDPATVQGEEITEDADYEGVRVTFQGWLHTGRIHMQVDVGFGDVVIPSAAPVEYPTILDFPAPRLQGYSKESMVAEKFETMVKRGIVNSRMRDFFDVWFLSQQYDFDGATLTKAIRTTFSQRGTEIPVVSVALTSEFAEDPTKAPQWTAFSRNIRLANAPDSLGEVVAAIETFLKPILDALVAGRSFELAWHAPGPWS